MKKKSNAQLKKALWKVFATYIKRRDKGICFTCGKYATGYGMGAGHFIPKGAGGLALYFHQDNVHAQCTFCNLVLEGDHYRYGIKLGEKKVRELYALQHKIVKDYPFKERIEYYTRLNESKW